MPVGSDDANNDLSVQNLKPFREAFKGPIIAAGGFQKDTAEEELNSGDADLVCFGRWYLANPDFPVKFFSPSPLQRLKTRLLLIAHPAHYEGAI